MKLETIAIAAAIVGVVKPMNIFETIIERLTAKQPQMDALVAPFQKSP